MLIQINFVVWFLIASGSGARRRAWISQGERNYSGADAALAGELARRLRPLLLDPPAHNHSARHSALLRTIRRQLRPPAPAHTRRQAYKDDPAGDEWERSLLRVEQQHIYATQYRLKEAQEMVNKYYGSAQFRIAYIFQMLDDWVTDLKIAYTYSRQWKRAQYTSWFPFTEFVIYYTHCFRKYMDIVYTIDFLLELNERVLHEMREIMKDPAATAPAAAPGAPPAG